MSRTCSYILPPRVTLTAAFTPLVSLSLLMLSERSICWMRVINKSSETRPVYFTMSAPTRCMAHSKEQACLRRIVDMTHRAHILHPKLLQIIWFARIIERFLFPLGLPLRRTTMGLDSFLRN